MCMGGAKCRSEFMMEVPMNAQNSWLPAEPDLETICKTYSNPIYSLSQAEIPAIILRNAYSPEQCSGLQQIHKYGIDARRSRYQLS